MILASTLSPLMGLALVVAAFGVAVFTFYGILGLVRKKPQTVPAVPDDQTEGPPKPPEGTGVPHIKLLWWAYIASDCMLFGSLIAGYLVYKGRSLTGPWPLDVFDFQTTTISTFILLTSSLTMVLQLAAIQRGDLGKFRLWNVATILCGLVFLGYQVFEFSTFIEEGLTMQTNLFGASFYLLTGFHGVHVAVGVLWMILLLVHSFWGGVTKKKAVHVEVAGLYWHFVDVVWIVIFSVVYLMEMPGS